MTYRRPHQSRLLRLACAAMAVLLAGAAAHAGEQKIRALVSGNTLLITNKYGTTDIYFDPSGVLLHRGPGPDVDRARWRATDDGVCSTADPTPDGKPFPEYCMPLKGRTIGETWTGDDPRNGSLVYKLVRGDARKHQ